MLVKELGELAPRLASNYGEKSQSHAIKMSSSLPPKKKDVEMFHGLEVPQEPREPQSEECCMSGCAVCVYDLYEESMDAYLDAIMAFCSSLSSLKIPQSKWPASIRRAQSSLSLDSLSPPDSGRQKKEVVMSAFEELERALEAKQQVNTTGEGRVDRVRRQSVCWIVSCQRISNSYIAHIVALPSPRRPAGSHSLKESWWAWWTRVYEVVCWITFSNR